MQPRMACQAAAAGALIGFLSTASMVGAGASAAPKASTVQPGVASFRVEVDPRVELLSLLFRLAGNPEYSRGRVEGYTADVEARFNGFRDHDAVRIADELRRRRGVSYDACMSMAVHLDNARDLKLLVPLDPWPEGLDRRWTVSDANRFLEALRRFVKDTSFQEFLDRHLTLYQTTENRMRTLMEKEGHLEWFREFFGERPKAMFTLAPGLLNGGSCYGARCQGPGGQETLYCILGVWKTDSLGLPEFSRDMLGTVVHEFAHSYANPVIDRHLAELKAAGDALFQPVSDKMRSQAYASGKTLLCESLVRACEVRYAFRYGGSDAGRRAIASHQNRGFLWMDELSVLLADYEAHRDKYPTLESFSPRIIAFFNDYAARFPEQQKQLESKRPKALSITPANGAEDVDPNLTVIQVVFDRPMVDGSWSMVGGGPNFPEIDGKPHYDPSRKTWTAPVKLKPDWDYRFMLNSETYQSFRSEDGVPLEPVSVSFKTGKSASAEKQPKDTQR